MTYKEYVELANLSVPFIFTGAGQVDGQPGVPNWTFDRIKEYCGDLIVPLNYKNKSLDSGWSGIEGMTEDSLDDFIDQVQDPSIEKGWPDSLNDLYLHDWSVSINCPDFLQDYVVPKYFSLDKLQQTTEGSDHWPSLFIGNKGTASGLHADWAATAAWMGLLKGRKLWAIGNPIDRPLYYEDPDNENQFAGNILEPDFKKYPAQRFTVYYEDILEEGEIIFIPAASPHQVQNLELIIAIAANYVDTVNIQQFLSQTENSFQMVSSNMEFLQYQTVCKELRALPQQEELDDQERSFSYDAFKA